MKSPDAILAELLREAERDLDAHQVKNEDIHGRINYVCRCLGNRAGVRLLMACMLAKVHRPEVDPRQPYTEIGGKKCFSGRSYDERHITHFINVHQLPCNSTTAFLTPALRNMDAPLTTNVVLVGRPPQVYADTLMLLDDVAKGRVRAKDVLIDAIRVLLQVRNEKQARMKELLAGIQLGKGSLPLSAEGIVKLIDQHLKCPYSSRLPVLIVAAAYEAAGRLIGQAIRPLETHNAADQQTGSIGDVEVCLENDDRVVTCYEMKLKRVTIDDIDRAVQKALGRHLHVDNYVFISTDIIDPPVAEYAASMYERTGGMELVVLDCMGFLRHFLHFFHRLRLRFLDAYQRLVLAEPDSSVRQPLKEAFLALRQAAESDE
jgi:hypothetical protein